MMLQGVVKTVGAPCICCFLTKIPYLGKNCYDSLCYQITGL